MATLINTQVEWEISTLQQAFALLTDSGDHINYTHTLKPWSAKPGFSYIAAGTGVINGGAVIPAVAGTNDLVDVSSVLLFAPGMTGADTSTGQITISATTGLTCLRGATTDICRINSITVSTAGVWAVVSGTASTAFTETRGAAGGPPFIPVGSVEVAQVRFNSITAAPVTAADIYATPGTHQESATFPAPLPDPILGKVAFSEALPLSHTGSVTKRVYARVATAGFAPFVYSRNFKPAKVSNSVGSEQYYRLVRGTFSQSIGAASFEISLEDGVTDSFVTACSTSPTMLFRYKPDRDKTAYSITQGVPSIDITNTAGAHPVATVTIAAQQATAEFAS